MNNLDNNITSNGITLATLSGMSFASLALITCASMGLIFTGLSTHSFIVNIIDSALYESFLVEEQRLLELSEEIREENRSIYLKNLGIKRQNM